MSIEALLKMHKIATVLGKLLFVLNEHATLSFFFGPDPSTSGSYVFGISLNIEDTIPWYQSFSVLTYKLEDSNSPEYDRYGNVLINAQNIYEADEHEKKFEYIAEEI